MVTLQKVLDCFEKLEIMLRLVTIVCRRRRVGAGSKAGSNGHSTVSCEGVMQDTEFLDFEKRCAPEKAVCSIAEGILTCLTVTFY